MDEIAITCPHCGKSFPLNDALAAQLHARFDAEHQARLAAAVRDAETRAQAEVGNQLAVLKKLLEQQTEKLREAESRELAARQKALELEQGKSQAVEKARLETEERLRREAEERTRAAIAQAEQRALEAAALEKQQLEACLAEERARLEQAQKVELELARRLDAKKAEWEASLRQTLGAEQDLKLREKEKQIEDLRRVIDDLKRKSEQGSQELQGEVFELDIESVLAARFPADEIKPVKKGARGADVVHVVRNEALQSCGSIVWEAKNAKNWQPAWIEKLKDDQRAAGAGPRRPGGDRLARGDTRLRVRGRRMGGGSCDLSGARCSAACPAHRSGPRASALHGCRRQDGGALRLPHKPRIPPPGRGDRRGVYQHAIAASARAPRHGKAMGRAREADRARHRQYHGHVRRARRDHRAKPARDPGAQTRAARGPGGDDMSASLPHWHRQDGLYNNHHVEIAR